MSRDKYNRWTQLLCLKCPTGAFYSHSFCFSTGSNNACSTICCRNTNRPSPKKGVLLLLNTCKKRVKIDMKDNTFHKVRLSDLRILNYSNIQYRYILTIFLRRGRMIILKKY